MQSSSNAPQFRKLNSGVNNNKQVMIGIGPHINTSMSGNASNAAQVLLNEELKSAHSIGRNSVKSNKSAVSKISRYSKTSKNSHKSKLSKTNNVKKMNQLGQKNQATLQQAAAQYNRPSIQNARNQPQSA